jgi:hypothetical protein
MFISRHYWSTAAMQQLHISQTHTGIWIWQHADLRSQTLIRTRQTRVSSRDGTDETSKEMEMVGRLHSDICNVPTHLLPGVGMQIKLTKAKREFYLMNKDADSKVVFRFLDVQLLVQRVRPNPAYLIAHNNSRAIAKYNLTRVEFMFFTFASGSQSLSIDNVVLGILPKRMLFTFMKNKDILGLVDSLIMISVILHCMSMANRSLALACI